MGRKEVTLFWLFCCSEVGTLGVGVSTGTGRFLGFLGLAESGLGLASSWFLPVGSLVGRGDVQKLFLDALRHVPCFLDRPHAHETSA